MWSNVCGLKVIATIYLNFSFINLQGARLLESNFINNTSMVFCLCLRVCKLSHFVYAIIGYLETPSYCSVYAVISP